MRYIRHPEFKRNGGALGMQEVVFLVTNLAFAVVLSRGLGHENYAVYSVIVQWVGRVIWVRDCPNPVISEVSRNHSKVKYALRRSIIFVSAFSVVFAVGVFGVISIVELYPGLVGCMAGCCHLEYCWACLNKFLGRLAFWRRFEQVLVSLDNSDLS